MRRGIFITGTDTGVGKTLISGSLASALRKQGMNVGVMKPVESGCSRVEGRLIPSDALFLKEFSRSNDDIDLINPYRLEHPLAPAAAAEMEGVKIELKRIEDAYNRMERNHDLMLVEGAGGLLVPLGDSLLIVDLIKSLRLPALVIACSSLGTINHTLLTLRTAEVSGIEVLGVIINHVTPDRGLAEETCVSSIKKFTRVPILGVFPFVEDAKIKNREYLGDLMERCVNIDIILECLKGQR
ncbi:MAG: dethiobiotin synthase [Proteobacteria bacterium]|nr:dethiobiotin synthase [Pseudomonadota bacterium]